MLQLIYVTKVFTSSLCEKVFTMLFYRMSKNQHNIIQKPNFSCIFQLGTNSLPFRKLKKLNQSENPRQPLTVTNATTNLPKHTTVRNFLPYGTFLKGDTP